MSLLRASLLCCGLGTTAFLGACQDLTSSTAGDELEVTAPLSGLDAAPDSARWSSLTASGAAGLGVFSDSGCEARFQLDRNDLHDTLRLSLWRADTLQAIVTHFWNGERLRPLSILRTAPADTATAPAPPTEVPEPVPEVVPVIISPLTAPDTSTPSPSPDTLPRITRCGAFSQVMALTGNDSLTFRWQLIYAAADGDSGTTAVLSFALDPWWQSIDLSDAVRLSFEVKSSTEAVFRFSLDADSGYSQPAQQASVRLQSGPVSATPAWSTVNISVTDFILPATFPGTEACRSDARCGTESWNSVKAQLKALNLSPVLSWKSATEISAGAAGSVSLRRLAFIRADGSRLELIP